MPWWTHPAFYLPVHYGLIVLFFFATFATFGSDVAVHLLYAATFPLIFLGYFHISLGGLGVILTPLLWWSALRWAIRLERRWL